MKLRKSDVKWARLDGRDGIKTLKQHGYVPDICRVDYSSDLYIGNIGLCHCAICGNENNQVEEYYKIEREKMNKEKICKLCERIYQKLL